MRLRSTAYPKALGLAVANVNPAWLARSLYYPDSPDKTSKHLRLGGFPKLRGTLGIPIIRTVVIILGSILGYSNFGKLRLALVLSR